MESVKNEAGQVHSRNPAGLGLNDCVYFGLILLLFWLNRLVNVNAKIIWSQSITESASCFHTEGT